MGNRFRVALVALVLLAMAAGAVLALHGGMMTVNTGCAPQYKLILADGTVFDLQGPGRQPGSSASLQALEGAGLPPIQLVRQPIYDTPGALLVDLNVETRVITITESVWSTNQTREGMHRALAQLWDAVRWDRGSKDTDPIILRYTLGAVSKDLHVNFSGAVESQQGRFGRNELVALRFEAGDPLWYNSDSESQTLDWQDSYTMRSIAAKIDGLWDPLGPPAAVGGSREPNTIVRDPVTGDTFVGGSFTGWAGLPGVTGNYVARWDVSAGAWAALGGGLSGRCYRLYWGPDNQLYAVGNFINGSGGAGDALADYVARWDRATDTWVNVGGGPGAGAFPLTDIVILGNGTMVLGGAFANWDAMGADNLVALPLPYDAGAWVDIGTPDAFVQCLEVARNGNLFAGGGFANIGALAAESVAEYDPVAGTWAAMGDGITGVVYDMAVAKNGNLYIAGDFVALGGGDPMLYITCWTGGQYTDLDGGMDAEVYRVAVDDLGDVYAAGAFSEAGSLTTPDGCARWNGFSWTHLDIDPPGNGGGHYIGIVDGDILLGFDTVAGTGYVAGDNVVVNEGSAFALPTITVTNYGLLRTVINETTGQIIPCNMQVLDGEQVVFDLSFGAKTAVSNWRGNRLGDILPGDDMGSFKLESSPRAAAGSNLVTVFITDAIPRESGDNNNQVSSWEVISGISQANTDLGRLYVNIVAEGAGVYHLDFYMDAAKAAGDLVAHSASYNAPGAVNILPDNASGLGGQVLIDNVVAADTNIVVWFTICTLSWTSRFWSLDEAILSAAP